MPEFSVLAVTHLKEPVENLEAFFASVAAQSVPAQQVVLVLDGAVSAAHHEVIDHWSEQLPLDVFEKEKEGLAPGLNYGLARCAHPFIMRCDTDDVNLPERFATLLKLFRSDDIVLTSSSIREVFSDGGHLFRALPDRVLTARSLSTFLRSPVNHNNCCYRKDAVLAVGGYPPGRMEDFRLWIKLLKAGGKFRTIPRVLLDASAQDIGKRRQGADYRRAEIALLWLNSSRGFGLGTLIAAPIFVLRYAMRLSAFEWIQRRLYAGVLRKSSLSGSSDV